MACLPLPVALLGSVGHVPSHSTECILKGEQPAFVGPSPIPLFPGYPLFNLCFHFGAESLNQVICSVSICCSHYCQVVGVVIRHLCTLRQYKTVSLGNRTEPSAVEIFSSICFVGFFLQGHNGFVPVFHITLPWS